MEVTKINVKNALNGLKMSVENVILNTYNNNKRRNTMSVATSTYKVGDLYTSQKSKVTGTILAIDPQANGNVRVKLDVNGITRYTTWTPKQ
jgi:phage-related minor tail protein